MQTEREGGKWLLTLYSMHGYLLGVHYLAVIKIERKLNIAARLNFIPKTWSRQLLS